jgi:hypothetical protein
MRTDKHFRLPEATVGKLEDLVVPGRRTMTDAVVMAVDLLHGRAAHDDAVDLLVEELRALRQQAEKNAADLAALSAQVQAVAGTVTAITGLERSIDKLGEHQLQLAEAVNNKLAQPVSSGIFGRRA